jgi:hypothetical protein
MATVFVPTAASLNEKKLPVTNAPSNEINVLEGALT